MVLADVRADIWGLERICTTGSWRAARHKFGERPTVLRAVDRRVRFVAVPAFELSRWRARTRLTQPARQMVRAFEDLRVFAWKP